MVELELIPEFENREIEADPDVGSVRYEGGSAPVIVDSDIDPNSSNPVENRAIATALAGKGTYSKPASGIPKSHLASDVQASLNKADEALSSSNTGTNGQVFTKTPSGQEWKDPSIATDAQIEAAVDEYLEDHPTVGGVFSNAAKHALLSLLEKVAYIDEDGQEYLDTLETELFTVEVASISAVFNPGTTVIYTDDTLDSLKQYLTVTATYIDETTEVLPDSVYTLSGTLAAGTQTITATYSGKNDTFTVNCTVRGWLYHFNNSILSSGNHDFGFSGVQNYADGINGRCYFHEVGTEGDASTDPLGLYALQSTDVPTWGSNDFTIAGWQKCVTPMRGHLFAASNYVGTTQITWSDLTVQTQDSNWTVGHNGITQKYLGIRLGTVSARLSVDITDATGSNGQEIYATPPSSFDSTQWHHYALTRHSNTLYYFVDGHLIWTATLPAGTEIYSSNYITMGNFMSENTDNTVTQYPYSAYYDDLYVNVGSAKWTTDFDPMSIEY